MADICGIDGCALRKDRRCHWCDGPRCPLHFQTSLDLFLCEHCDDLYSRIEEFLMAWRVLEREGACDGFGGAEYRRLRLQWMAEEMPRPCGDWIRREANRPPSPAAPPRDSPPGADGGG